MRFVSFPTLWTGSSRAGRVTSDVIRCMGATQPVGVGGMVRNALLKLRPEISWVCRGASDIVRGMGVTQERIATHWLWAHS